MRLASTCRLIVGFPVASEGQLWVGDISLPVSCSRPAGYKTLSVFPVVNTYGVLTVDTPFCVQAGALDMPIP